MVPRTPAPDPCLSEKDLRQAEFLANRLLKNDRHLRKWARREGIEAYRLYDRDIPEIPLAIDRYNGILSAESAEPAPPALLMALYERPYEKDPALEEAWLDLMALSAGEALEIAPENIFTRTRKRQRGEAQYEKLGTGRAERVIREAGLSFIVNLTDYLDTGLFLDHRPTRALVRAESAGKRVLNLFCYTGSFSVYAAAGGAREVVSVDLSNTYLAWAERNLKLNGFSGSAYPLIRGDVPSFLQGAAAAGERWDLIVLDPPTFSNSKSAPESFDINRDWPGLVGLCRELLAPGGSLYFSTNSRRLAWDPERVPGAWEELGEAGIPPDFRDRRVHRAWRLRLP